MGNACGCNKPSKHRNNHYRFSADMEYKADNNASAPRRHSMPLPDNNDSTRQTHYPTNKKNKKKNKKHHSANSTASSAANQVPRLLLLGAGDSGKSTLSRQARLLHGAPFEASEIRRFADSIRFNAVTSAQTLVKEINRHRIRLHKLIPGFAEDMQKTAAARAVIEAAKPPLQDQIIPEELALAIAEFWAASSTKLVFRRRDDFEFYIFDTANHFWDRIIEISVRDYVPTTEDIMACRIRTTGIVETRISIKAEDNSAEADEFSLIDVGGQRSERLKWVHFFDDDTVAGILYVAALSEYNQVLYEDAKTNRMQEALELWRGVVRVRSLRNAALILFLNKIDLFEAKLSAADMFGKSKGIRSAFPDYDGPAADVEESLKFIQSKFEDVLYEEDEKFSSQNARLLNMSKDGLLEIDLEGSDGDNNRLIGSRSGSNKQKSKTGSRGSKLFSNKNSGVVDAEDVKFVPRELFVHITCATQTDQMSVVFESLRKSMINHSLRLSGLL